MKISVYVPKELERHLRQQAEEQSMTPSLFVQSLVRERFEQEPRRFTEAFAALAGSWEDERSAGVKADPASNWDGASGALPR